MREGKIEGEEVYGWGTRKSGREGHNKLKRSRRQRN